MRMRLALLLALTSGTSLAQLDTAYVVGINVLRPVASPPSADPQYRSLHLSSTFSAFNTADTLGTVELDRRYDQEGPKAPRTLGAIILPPQKAVLATTTDCDYAGVLPSCVQLIRVRKTTGVVIRSTLERVVDELIDCDLSGTFPPNSQGIPQGRVPLPVFTTLFSPSERVALGEVVPFSPGPPDICGAQKYRRRLNLTLFNGGVREATFTVRAVKATYQSPEVVFQSTYGVPAESLVQENAIYAPSSDTFEIAGTSNLWLTVTADQPFLAYLSTTFDNPQAGAIAYEIFPPLR